mmetsp:Transcript_107703/g.300097  ORF Transcript_107703/g.300097 Transcript_107703/m.300097 type:complete len:288 (-) Transcript_107703:88-951(-)|eukprot:CAMPEP_0179044140 /NCGR_PEP_ID=MMETSP0796-20121207/17525_1 /TAXON_ID=73915 /ORGANISM="Pyrodinium bahamense, Strain pbaha01" /LENGTH=287 /DNA_ID=CAMNT_0020740539 /DNA_START=81 /DNA_END=944 /DNA_ORIENTATION=+
MEFGEAWPFFFSQAAPREMAPRETLVAAAGAFTADSVASVLAFRLATDPRVGGAGGSHSAAWQAVQGEILERIVFFLLEPLGRFSSALPQGSRVELEADGRGMRKLLAARGSGWAGRLESTACGAQAVVAGVAVWTVTCTGQQFMVGVVPDGQWAAFDEECPSYVPFVCNGDRPGPGFGVGLLVWDGLFLCRRGHPDQRLSLAEEVSPGTHFTITLDLQRLIVAFSVEGKPMASAAVLPAAAHRFAASVYGVGAKVRFVQAYACVPGAFQCTLPTSIQGRTGMTPWL